MTRVEVNITRALRLLRRGDSLTAVAPLVGCCRGTLRKRLRELDEAAPPRGRRPRYRFTPAEIRRHVQRHGSSPAALKSLAGRRHVSRQTLMRQILALGGLSAVLRGEARPVAPAPKVAPSASAEPAPCGDVSSAGSGLYDAGGLAAALLYRDRSGRDWTDAPHEGSRR